MRDQSTEYYFEQRWLSLNANRDFDTNAKCITTWGITISGD